ncbi:hypothetical protein [Gloeocapsa sp. PCC 73106]|uniref:hypothetical protein n=1 Tax=Gloeocapsa sp. PCC 73106 TaxID=102232 RepID=UPI001181AA3E|nr:hypothetical protein [Gloeocapsa sp. PCC 73106]
MNTRLQILLTVIYSRPDPLNQQSLAKLPDLIKSLSKLEQVSAIKQWVTNNSKINKFIHNNLFPKLKQQYQN